MDTCVTDELGQAITAYWDHRARTYSNGVRGELADNRHCAWQRLLAQSIADVMAKAKRAGRVVRALDLGCGPGFFSILLAEKGCAVDAIDMSAGMLAQARANVEAAVPGANVAFHQCDAALPPFDDATFDIVTSRNLTWLMREPEQTYAEWLRVLRPGGKLLVFDANWYRYLVDDEVAQARLHDQTGAKLEEYDEDSMASDDEERQCELIAAELPLTSILRPQWDVEVLERLGAARVRADERVWCDLWTKSEQAFYGSSPLFMIEAYRP